MASSTDLPKYDETVNFLKSQCKVLERWEGARSTTTIETKFEPKQSSTESKLPSQQVLATTTKSQEPKDKCDFCRGFHLNYQCNKLNAFSANDRMEKVKAAGICFNCLRKGHQVKNCPAPKSCRKCQCRHHTQLHDDDANVTPASTSTAASTIPDDNLEQACESVSSTSNPIPTSEQPVPTSCSCQNTQSSKTVLLLTAVILLSDETGQQQKCRVLLDSGSQVNLISEKMANSLGIRRRQAGVSITGISNIRTTARDKIEVSIKSRCSDFRTRLECLVIPQMTGTIPSKSFDTTNWNIPPSIQMADPAFFRADSIDMLIGAKLLCKLLKPGHIIIDERLPELRESHFGWLVAGAIQSVPPSDNTQYSQVASIEDIADLIYKVSVEEEPEATSMSSNEQQYDEHFVPTCYHESQERSSKQFQRSTVKLRPDVRRLVLGDQADLDVNRCQSSDQIQPYTNRFPSGVQSTPDVRWHQSRGKAHASSMPVSGSQQSPTSVGRRPMHRPFLKIARTRPMTKSSLTPTDHPAVSLPASFQF